MTLSVGHEAQRVCGTDPEDVLLSLEDLHVVFETYFGVARALSGIDLRLQTRKITGLVGETGCGKSVTAKAILGLIPPPGRIVSGRIIFEGTDLLRLSPATMGSIRGNRIAMIFQNPRAALNPLFTVNDQIYFLLRRHQGLSRREARKRGIELLHAVKIADPERRINNYPFELSTGMCQRVMIAMSLACQPRFLIADEPTTGLDVTIQAQILELFAELVYDFGSTALVITHDLGVVAETCDFTAVMYTGQIVEFGTTEDVFQHTTHPYTVGLLASCLIGEEGEKLRYIRGSVPDLTQLPEGCTFRQRCDAAHEGCSENRPPVVDLGNGHIARCCIPPSSQTEDSGRDAVRRPPLLRAENEERMR